MLPPLSFFPSAPTVYHEAFYRCNTALWQQGLFHIVYLRVIKSSARRTGCLVTKNNSDYSILYSLNSPYVLKVYYKNTPMREGELPPANLSTIVCSVGKFKILYETARAWKSLHNINKSLNNNNNNRGCNTLISSLSNQDIIY